MTFDQIRQIMALSRFRFSDATDEFEEGQSHFYLVDIVSGQSHCARFSLKEAVASAKQLMSRLGLTEAQLSSLYELAVDADSDVQDRMTIALLSLCLSQTVKNCLGEAYPEGLHLLAVSYTFSDGSRFIRPYAAKNDNSRQMPSEQLTDTVNRCLVADLQENGLVVPKVMERGGIDIAPCFL